MRRARADGHFDFLPCENMQQLVDNCKNFYNTLKENTINTSESYQRRIQLSKWIRKFHQDCGTLTPNVKDAIDKIRDKSCVFLMTAHQPNLFAYSGVFRKATLTHVLAQRLSEDLNVPVVVFFGIADQDFTDDRWVKSALLPDVERRGGGFELRINLPEKLMLNRVVKPSRQVLDDWRNHIKNWLGEKLGSVKKHCKSLGIEFSPQEVGLTKNFEDFWSIVEEAYEKADSYSNFNAFVMSRIVNEVWGYDTLFSRFSECQQIFEHEFCFLLSRFEEYSRYVREATLFSENSEWGVFKNEFNTIPFWYHCDCGSKARLMAELQGQLIFGHGECLRCGKDYKFEFSSKTRPNVSGILSRISARSITMPLVFFDGLKVCCYVGGVGGKEYLRQAKYVAEHLGKAFPPLAIWRPKDVYFGVGQLEALMMFRRLSGTFDFSQCSIVKARFKREFKRIKESIGEVELQKRRLAAQAGAEKEEIIKEMKALSAKQNEIRKKTGFSVLVRNLKLLENVKGVLGLFPCIVDYAVNVGLKATSEQWVAFLKEDGSLSSDVNLKTDFDDLVKLIIQ